MRITLAWLNVFVILLLASCGTYRSQEQAGEIPGAIECAVTDVATGETIQGAVVDVSNTGLWGKTDKRGTVVVRPLDPNSYTIVISHPDYYPDTIVDIPVMSSTRSLVPRQIRRRPMGRIVGIITDRMTGEPVLGACVSVAGANQGVITDFDGAYIIDRVEEGTYDVLIGHLEYDSVTVPNIEIVDGRDTPVSCELTHRADQTFDIYIKD